MQDVTAFAYKEAKIQEWLQRHLNEASLALAQRLALEAENTESAAGGSKAGRRSATSTQQAGYFERYITRIKDNLQIGISNVHVRLEDPGVQLGRGTGSAAGGKTDKMCIGVTLKRLDLRTFDYR